VEGTAASLFLRQNDKLRPITGRAIDPARDVATITVPGLTCPCAPIAPTGAMALEADVIAIGYPWGGENTVTAGYLIGRVQVVNPDESDGILSGQYIAVLIRVEPGNSGGGLFVRRDGEWQLIGITSWGFTGGGDRRPAFFVEIAPWSS
jgi:S1-C subfamily serine protease